MKKEILKVTNIESKRSPDYLAPTSLCLFEGRIAGFLGLDNSGKDVLVKLIEGELPPSPGAGHFSIEGNVIRPEEIRTCIYRVRSDNFLIGDWSIYEYIGLESADPVRYILNRKYLKYQVDDMLGELGLDYDSGRLIGRLSEFEKMVVDTAKAVILGKKIIIVEDELENMTYSDIHEFREILKILVDGKASVIINNHSLLVTNVLSDELVIFRGGRIIKKSPVSIFADKEEVEALLTGEKEKGERRFVSRGGEHSEENVYTVKGLYLAGEKHDFSFYQGEVAALLMVEHNDKKKAFDILSGRDVFPGVEMEKSGKLAYVSDLGGTSELFPHMSVKENLMIPSIRKLSFFEYLRHSLGIERMVGKSVDREIKDSLLNVSRLSINDIIRVTLERWYIFNPAVLVLYEPFLKCDANGVGIVLEYLKKITEKGTAVILILSRDEYIKDIADRSIII